MRFLAIGIAILTVGCQPTPSEYERPLVLPAAPIVAPPTPTPAAPMATAVAAAPPPAIIAIHTTPNADVRISDGRDEPVAHAIANLEGIARFPELPIGAYEIWAIGDHRASPIVRISDIPATPIELALAPAASLRGRIDGAPQATGTVQLTPLDLDQQIRTVPIANGRFVADSLPPGHWRIDAAIPGFIQSAELTTLATTHDADVVVRLDRAGAMSGLVVDGDGAPVRNATIVVRRQTSDGTQALAQRPISFGRLRWVFPIAGHRQLPSNPAALFGGSRPGARNAECGLGHCGIDLVMPKGSVVHAAGDGEITVVRTDLRDNAGRFVAIDHGGGLVTMYMHLDQVREGLEVGQKIRAGSSLGTVGTTGYDPKNAAPHLHFAVTQVRNDRTWYVDPEPMLRRAVVLATPRSMERVDGIAVVEPRTDNGATSSVAVTTDARGAFRIDDLVAGSYVALAFASELAPGTSDPVVVRSGATSDGVTVTLRPGAILRGTIASRSGPLAGATIIATAGTGESASDIATTYSNATGDYVLRALSGKLTLTVTSPKYGTVSRAIDVDTRRQEDFTLVVEDAHVRGVVQSPDGVVANATVRIVDGPSRRTVTTGATGEFSLGTIASGRYVVEIVSPDHPTKRVTLDSDRFAEIRLDPSGSAHVLVGDSRSHEPIGAIRVDARGPDGATVSRTSDAHGIVDLTGLAVGSWTLVARGTGYAPGSQTIAIRATRVPQDVRLDIAKGAILAGVVRDRRGTRLGNARVSVGDVSTQADADGNFRLIDVPSGTITVEATLGDLHGSLDLQLAAGDERVTLGIEVE